MKSQREIEYLQRFPTFSPEKKREHLAFALRFLLGLMREKYTAVKPSGLDVVDRDGCPLGAASVAVGDAEE